MVCIINLELFSYRFSIGYARAFKSFSAPHSKGRASGSCLTAKIAEKPLDVFKKRLAGHKGDDAERHQDPQLKDSTQ